MNVESPSVMKERSSSRLILVSNRLPIQLAEKDGKVFIKQSDGGLVTALKSYFDQESTKDTFQEKIWVGAADFPEKRWAKLERTEAAFEIVPLFIEPKVYNKY